MKVHIVIPTRNGRRHLEHLLPSISEQSCRPDEITVVVTGSSDGTAQWLRQLHSHVHVIEDPGMRTFSEASNKGMRFALENHAEVILLLNDDTILQPNSLANLLSACEKHPEAGIFGPKVVFASAPDVINSAGLVIHPSGEAFDRGVTDPDGPPYDESIEVAAVTGAALFVRREVLEQVGLFDERFGFYYEDVDLCLRTLSAGWRVRYVAESTVLHVNGGSFTGSGRYRWVTSSRLRFSMRYFGFHVTTRAVKDEVRSVADDFRAGRRRIGLARMRGIGTFILSFPRQLFSRRKGFHLILGNLLSHLPKPAAGPIPIGSVARDHSLSNRIFAGIQEGGLVSGWLSCLGDAPRYRWSKQSARLRLDGGSGGHRVLQLVAGRAGRPACGVKVSIRDEDLGMIELGPDFRIIHFPIDCLPGVNEITFEYRNLGDRGANEKPGFAMIEASLLGHDSPLLRDAL